ncbi:hypothetical protein [Sphingomonas bacterium]|uniref:hypothetical protein n=1 Tax=Sphingomonas bacterium TaxID=1895847 RepID=UPI0015752EBE|nr:hypothetical protein [Sphingomonas bacterium]
MPTSSAATILGGTTRPAVRLGLSALWLIVVGYLAVHHVFWRDEVRALSLALPGGDVVAMAKAVHGEGHPLLWYLLLRAAHAVAPVREVLPAVGLIVGIAGASFFAWRAPFRPPVMVAVLFGGWMAFEYSVMARNYGLSMLLMFVIADRFARGRDGTMATGALLFFLVNTNVPSVILAGGLLLFRLVEIVASDGWRWSPALGRWLGAAGIALVGVVLCFLTVYPPFNEAALAPGAASLSMGSIAAAALNVGGPLSSLWPDWAWTMPGAAPLLALLILAGPLSLLRAPAAAIAAIVVLPMMLLFFQFVYPGSYRHQALYLCFVVALHWIVAGGRGGWRRTASPLLHDRVPVAAGIMLIVLLYAQLGSTASVLVQVARGRVEGQSAALAQLLRRPALRHAIVLGVSEVVVEPLPYYIDNPTYLLRQRRFGAVSHFTRHADLHLTLAGILRTARQLQATTDRQVVILMQYRIGRNDGPQTWDERILGDTTAGPGDAAAFRDATRLIQTPVELIRYGSFDENYWVYLLKPAVTGS